MAATCREKHRKYPSSPFSKIHDHVPRGSLEVQARTGERINPSNTNRCWQGFRLECIYKVTNYVLYYRERERAPTNVLINVSCSHDKRFIFIIL